MRKARVCFKCIMNANYCANRYCRVVFAVQRGRKRVLRFSERPVSLNACICIRYNLQYINNIDTHNIHVYFTRTYTHTHYVHVVCAQERSHTAAQLRYVRAE